MSGNTFGTLFAVTNFGESHGPAIGCVIDGCPPGMALSEADIQGDLDRRRPGTSKFVTQRNEPDAVEILSGVYEGKTTGTPIALLIRNTDQRSKDYGDILQTFRPGHADYTYFHKYGLRDPRGGGRSSARLTAPMVAAGAVAKKWLAEKYGTTFHGCMTQIGDLVIPFESWDHVPNNPFFAPVADVSALEAYMGELRKAGDSCGARLRVTARKVPVGLGEPLFDKMDADIAFAMMGINAVKGVEIGAGFASVTQRGTTHGDSLSPQGFKEQQRRRRAGRHQHRAGPGSEHRHQADQFHPVAARVDRRRVAAPPRWSPRAATTPAWASAPRRSPRPCWRWW
jgi:chorismate synthase